MFTVNVAASVKISHQHRFEEPALRDVKAPILGQNLDVLHFLVEPAKKTKNKMGCLSLIADAARFYPGETSNRR